MSRVLLTGVHGFIGGALKEPLEARYELFAPGSAELDLRNEDSVKGFIEKNKIDYVIHSAVHNPRNRNQENELSANLRMFYNLARCSGMFEKMLFFGSGAEYDKRFPVENVIEERIGERIPLDDYGFSKYIMNEYARRTTNIFNLRLFGIFGPGEYWPLKFISNLCCKAIFGLPLTVRQNCYFDFLYIDDLFQAVEWFLNNAPKYQDYNVCTGKPIDLLSIVDTVQKVRGRNLPVKIFNEGFNLPYTASNKRLTQEFACFKTKDMEESVRMLYNWYSENKSIIDYEVLQKSF